MRSIIFGILAAFVLSSTAVAKPEKEPAANPLSALDWQWGPTRVSIPGGAYFDVPEGFGFLDEGETRKFQEYIQNIPTPGETLFLHEESEWFAIFRFEDTGYVEDDEEIDAAALLKSMRENQREANKELESRGWSTMTIDGWAHEPHYEPETQQLEWALALTTQPSGGRVVNYNTRVLGRRGVMEVILVTDPDALASDLVAFRGAMDSFSFEAEESYAAFQPGDKVAQYGLAALVVGGAAAVATKSGFLKSFGKAIAIGVFALLAGLWGRIKRLFRRKEDEQG